MFNALNESAERGELMLVDGGMCNWHLRLDGQLTIREIISTQPGAGSLMLRRLGYTIGATCLFAKCPAELKANNWWWKQGFFVERMERTRHGNLLICWKKVLKTFGSQPNAGRLEIIFCAGGNKRWAQAAIDSEMLYGAQQPSKVYFRPYMVDQNHNKLSPNTSTRKQRDIELNKYLICVELHRPHIATVIDWVDGIGWEEVMFWAEEVAPYVEVLVVIPKIEDVIKDIPERIKGVPVRLGYSVPTRYGGTSLPLSSFSDWTGGVHLLGGPPQKQLDIFRQLPNVRSVDTNYFTKVARWGMFFAGSPHPFAKNKWWPTLKEVGEFASKDMPQRAVERSCRNIMQAWREELKVDTK